MKTDDTHIRYKWAGHNQRMYYERYGKQILEAQTKRDTVRRV